MKHRKLTSRQLAHFRELLIERITELYRSVHADVRASMVRELYDRDEPHDEADESTRVQLRDIGMSLAENEASRAQQMESALQRIRSGTYGICADCGEPIEMERLRLVPWALRCIDDQEEAEHRQRPPAPTL